MSFSLRLVSCLNHIIGFSGKIEFNSLVIWISFQLSQISLQTLGFTALNVVTMTGVSVSSL